eukprot:m.438252 g.438252  ORF g.438252 m.438252 type:complete len:76 (+) comp21442_c1_seq2:687-914(+)
MPSSRKDLLLVGVPIRTSASLVAATEECLCQHVLNKYVTFSLHGSKDDYKITELEVNSQSEDVSANLQWVVQRRR